MKYVSPVALMLLVALAFGASIWQCDTSWKDSGYTSRFTIGAGCQVKKPGGGWVNEKFMREM